MKSTKFIKVFVSHEVIEGTLKLRIHMKFTEIIKVSWDWVL